MYKYAFLLGLMDRRKKPQGKVYKHERRGITRDQANNKLHESIRRLEETVKKVMS